MIIGLEGNTCVEECGEFNYIDWEENKCHSCPLECSTCEYSTYCTECHRGYKLNVDNMCLPCDIEGCEDCVEDKCLECESSLFITMTGRC